MNGVVGCLFGRVGHDAELRYTSQGTAFASVSVAVEDARRAEDSPAEWCRITVWADKAEELAPRLVKGTRIYAEGRLRLKTWTKDGAERSGLELSAWVCEAIGQIGRQRPRQDQSVPRRREAPAKTPAAASSWAAGGGPWGEGV